jgi:protein SCO1
MSRTCEGRQVTVGGGRAGSACVSVLLTIVVGLIGTVAAVLAQAQAMDPHAHHHVMPETSRALRNYVLPAVSLVRDDGTTVSLASELGDQRAVVLNFIYTTCTSVCPLTSQTFAELQRKLGASRDSVHLVSISIDPEQDTPARLREYATKFGAGPGWQHYTGTVAASIAAQRAFDVYRGDKMDHTPVTLLRTSGGDAWVRVEGFASAEQLLAELRPALASHQVNAADSTRAIPVH